MSQHRDPIPDVLERMRNTNWCFARADSRARAELSARIAEAGRNQQLITYSDVVRGVTFQIDTVRNGQPFQIDVHAWLDLDRSILGNFLGHISMETYERNGFIASAIVVGQEQGQPTYPSRLFYDWMRSIGLLTGATQDAELTFWAEESRRTLDAYAREP